MGDEKIVRCEIHKDQHMFEHWDRYYCPQCKRWYENNQQL